MALRLFVLTASDGDPPSVLLKERTAKIGRAIETEIRLPDPSVSAHHATIRKRGGNYILIDEGSRHGTAVSSLEAMEQNHPPVLLPPESPRVLRDGDHIWIGEIELAVVLEEAKRGAPSGLEELPYNLVRRGLQSVGLEPTDQLVTKTLAELTDLPDERLNAAIELEEFEREERLGVAALDEDDRNPPWVTDVSISILAIVIFSGCAYGIYHLVSLR